MCPRVGVALIVAANFVRGGRLVAQERAQAGAPPPTRKSREPFFDGLGARSRPVTTASPEAQRYFDQGLKFLFAFNHDEAIRSFRQAADDRPSLCDGLVGNRLRLRPAHQQSGR